MKSRFVQIRLASKSGNSPRRKALEFGRTAARTAGVNVASSAIAVIAGIIIARSLGPATRGEYAAIFVWFGVLLTVGELGQTAATTFFVAQNVQRAADYLATSRNMMIASGSVTLAVGMFIAPLLAHGRNDEVWGYRLMFATSLASFVGASFTFSLQAVSIPWWNMVRIFQPVLFGGVIVILSLTSRLTLLTALGAMSIAIVLQTVLAHQACRQQKITNGQASRCLARPMMRYGLSQLATAVPTMTSARLDQLVLSVAAAPAALGRYAVAASLTTLALPLASALGSVAFPLLAARGLSHGTRVGIQRQAMSVTAAIGIVVMAPLVVLAPWLIPAVFGPRYAESVQLVWLLAPGGVFLACGQVCGDLLRGNGRPVSVAWAQGAGAVVTVVLLSTLLPAMGVAGAAIASSSGTGIALVFMIRALRSHTAKSQVPSVLPQGATAHRNS